MRWRRFQHDLFADANTNSDVAYPNPHSGSNSNPFTVANPEYFAHADANAADMVAAEQFAAGAAGAGTSTAGCISVSTNHLQPRQRRNGKLSSQCCRFGHALESDFRNAGIR